jgi:cystathionine beta-lyase/cystathionine gamma-synthase
LARRQFGDRFGSMVTFTLAGGGAAATKFIQAAAQVPFCPSLGELNTTLSHPASTSHRGLSEPARAALGITDGTIRLSVGIESSVAVCNAVNQGLAGLS